MTSCTCFAIFLAAVAFGDDAPIKVTVGYVVSDPWFEKKEEGIASLELAIQKLKEDQVIRNLVSFEIITMPGCGSHSGPGAAVQLYKEYDTAVLFGPACSTGMEPAAKLAAYWNIPILSHLSSDQIFTDTYKYPTLARTTLTGKSEVGFAMAWVVKHFGWTRVGLLLGPHKHTELTGDGIRAGMAYYGIDISYDHTIKNETLELEKCLKNMKLYARIIILCFGLNPEDNREAMLMAQKLGMARSEFVFILSGTWFTNFLPWDDPKISQKDDENSAKLAYKNVLVVHTVILSSNPIQKIEHDAVEDHRIQSFMEKVNNHLNQTGEYAGSSSVYISQLHDAMYLYGLALNESLENDNISYKDGRKMLQKMKHKQFIGASGNVTIGVSGDRMPQYFVRSFLPDGSWRTIMAVDRIKSSDGKSYDRVMEIFATKWPEGSVPLDKPTCGFRMELCPEPYRGYFWYYITGGIVAGIGAIVVVFLLGKWHQKRKVEEAVFKMLWKIDRSKLNMVDKNPGRKLSVESLSSVNQASVNQARSTTAEDEQPKEMKMGFYNGSPVMVQTIIKKKNFSFEKDQLVHLKAMRDISSGNLNLFVGMSDDESSRILILWSRSTQRTLRDVLQNDSLTQDLEFRLSVLSDIVRGLEYIHRSPLSCHGRLTTDTSFVDSRMTVQLSGFGLATLFSDKRLVTAVQPVMSNNHLFYHIAPELLKQSNGALKSYFLGGSPQGDLFSLGIVMYQILFRRTPYEEHNDMPDQAVLDGLLSDNSFSVRPKVPDLANKGEEIKELSKVMQECWAESPWSRPSLAVLKTTLNRHTKRIISGNLLEHMLKMMERYAFNLEGTVEQKNKQLTLEKQKLSAFLASILPRSVADVVQAGGKIEPELYNCATVLFFEIMELTKLSAVCTPAEVVQLLCDVHTSFDDIIKENDAYKVETIAGTYMAVSGLPERNGDNHAAVIAEVALAMRQSAKAMKIPNKLDSQLQIRFGAHSGPVVAGVVGLAAPKYCVFGGTVNVACRMGSTSSPLKIQISGATMDFLDNKSDKYLISDRGMEEVDGSGLVSTFWLVGKKGVPYPPNKLIPVIFTRSRMHPSC